MAISERTLAKLERGQELNDSNKKHLSEIERLTEALEKVIDPDAVGRWLQQPNEALGGLKPLELVERGEIDRIWRMIFHLESGVAS